MTVARRVVATTSNDPDARRVGSYGRIEHVLQHDGRRPRRLEVQVHNVPTVVIRRDHPISLKRILDLEDARVP